LESRKTLERKLAEAEAKRKNDLKKAREGYDKKENIFKEKENLLNSLLGMVEDVYHLSRDELQQLDCIRALRDATENEGPVEEKKADEWGIVMTVGKAKEATDCLFTVAGGDEKKNSMSLVDFKALMKLLLSKFNPEMYKHLLEKIHTLYPDEDDMPDKLESMYSNWVQNKDAPDAETLSDSVALMIDDLEDSIGKKEFISLFSSHVVACGLMAPSWQFVERVIADDNKTAE